MIHSHVNMLVFPFYFVLFLVCCWVGRRTKEASLSHSVNAAPDDSNANLNLLSSSSLNDVNEMMKSENIYENQHLISSHHLTQNQNRLGKNFIPTRNRDYRYSYYKNVLSDMKREEKEKKESTEETHILSTSSTSSRQLKNINIRDETNLQQSKGLERGGNGELYNGLSVLEREKINQSGSGSPRQSKKALTVYKSLENEKIYFHSKIDNAATINNIIDIEFGKERKMEEIHKDLKGGSSKTLQPKICKSEDSEVKVKHKRDLLIKELKNFHEDKIFSGETTDLIFTDLSSSKLLKNQVQGFANSSNMNNHHISTKTSSGNRKQITGQQKPKFHKQNLSNSDAFISKTSLVESSKPDNYFALSTNQGPYEALPIMYIIFLIIWSLLCSFWCHQTFITNNNQGFKLCRYLLLIPGTKCLMMIISVLFWSSCHKWGFCSFWLGVVLINCQLFYETFTIVTFSLISKGWCITRSRLSIYEWRALVLLMCSFYLVSSCLLLLRRIVSYPTLFWTSTAFLYLLTYSFICQSINQRIDQLIWNGRRRQEDLRYMHLVLRSNENDNNENVNREEIGRGSGGGEEETTINRRNRNVHGNRNTIDIHAWERYNASLRNDRHLPSLRKKLRVFKSLRLLLIFYCTLELTFCTLPFCHILQEMLKNILLSFTSTRHSLIPLFLEKSVVSFLSFLHSCCNIMVYLEEHLWWTLLLHELCEIFIISLCGYLVRPSLFPLFISIDELPLPNVQNYIPIINSNSSYQNTRGNNGNNDSEQSNIRSLPLRFGLIRSILPIFSRLLSNLSNNLRSPIAMLSSSQRTNIGESTNVNQLNDGISIRQTSHSFASAPSQLNRIGNNDFENRGYIQREAAEENSNTESNSGTLQETSTALVIFNQYRYFSNPFSYLSTSTQPSRLGAIGSIFGGGSRPVRIVDSEYDPDFNFSTPSDINRANDLGMGRDVHYNYAFHGLRNNSDNSNFPNGYGYPYNYSSRVDYIFTPPPIYLKPIAVSPILDSYYIESLYLEKERTKQRILSHTLIREKENQRRRMRSKCSRKDSVSDLEEEKIITKLGKFSSKNNMAGSDLLGNSASYYLESDDNETQEKGADNDDEGFETETSIAPPNLESFLMDDRSSYYDEDPTDLCQYQDEKERRLIIKAQHRRSRRKSRSRSSSDESFSCSSVSTDIDESVMLQKGFDQIYKGISTGVDVDASTSSINHEEPIQNEEEALPRRQERTVSNGLDNSLSSTVVPTFNSGNTINDSSSILNSTTNSTAVSQLQQYSNLSTQRATSPSVPNARALVPRLLSGITDIVVWRRPVVQDATRHSLVPLRSNGYRSLSPLLYNNRSSFSPITRAEYRGDTNSTDQSNSGHDRRNAAIIERVQQNSIESRIETNFPLPHTASSETHPRRSWLGNNEIGNNMEDKRKRLRHHPLHEAYVNNNMLLVRQPRHRFQVAVLEKEL